MTDEEADAIGKRLAACKGFKPVSGMRDTDGRTWTPDLLFRWHNTDVPDLRDAATVGCMVELFREVAGLPTAHLLLLRENPTYWVVATGAIFNTGKLFKAAPTQQEALVNAWEEL